MFRVNASAKVPAFPLAERIVLATLLLALLANFGSDYLILQEQYRLAAWLGGAEPVTPVALEALQQNLRIQFVCSMLLSAIPIFCLAVMAWLRRRYLLSEQSLRQVKMMAHNILTSMNRGVVTTDRAGTITSINSAGLALLHVPGSCVGQPLASIAPPDVPLVEVYREVVEDQGAVRDRDFIAERAGRRQHLRVDGHMLKDTEGETLGCVVHIRDVTERKLLEERMRRMERFLGLATLASGLHHEIKNPLTALSIHLQLLEESLAEGTAGVDELVGVLKTEVCRLNGVLESFRSFAHWQHLSVQPTDALGILEDAIRLIRPQAAEQQVQITLLHSEQPLPPVPLDAEKFEQAVLNLVINALEAMPEGGLLTISAVVREGTFRVSIRDSGPGIPAEVQKNLFQPYFSTKSKGSGLGLALSEKVINQHGGQIDYRTGPEGTTFEIHVPLEQGAANP